VRTIVLFSIVMLPLLVTLALETAVAAVFRVGRRALRAVACVNLVTNPLLNALILVLFALDVGFTRRSWNPGYGKDHEIISTATWLWVTLAAIEVVIVIVEWRLLVWATRGTRNRSSRLLALSVAMNAVSGLLGSWLLM
jgi:hypothetical protein